MLGGSWRGSRPRRWHRLVNGRGGMESKQTDCYCVPDAAFLIKQESRGLARVQFRLIRIVTQRVKRPNRFGVLSTRWPLGNPYALSS